jgi:hypothetical protein
VTLEDLDDDVQASFLDGYCWADPAEDEREDLAALLARQPNQLAFQRGLELAYVSTQWSAATEAIDRADWLEALEDTIQFTNAQYGRIVTVDEESGIVRLVHTDDDPG